MDNQVQGIDLVVQGLNALVNPDYEFMVFH
jgi:hypothetical protein